MKKDIKTILVFVFSCAGLLFAGYLGGTKFFTSTCAFNESCPYFLGYPACYYGFAMYLALTIFSYMLITDKIQVSKGLRGTIGVSLLGILFAGYFTLGELPVLFEKGMVAYALGLPTCALGLVFYITIFVLSLLIRRKAIVIA